MRKIRHGRPTNSPTKYIPILLVLSFIVKQRYQSLRLMSRNCDVSIELTLCPERFYKFIVAHAVVSPDAIGD